MKCDSILFLLITALCGLSFLSAYADEKTPFCTLRNKEFCGRWNGSAESVRIDVTGEKLIWRQGPNEKDSVADARCQILEEGHHDGRAASILKCHFRAHGTKEYDYEEDRYYLLKIKRFPQYSSPRIQDVLFLYFDTELPKERKSSRDPNKKCMAFHLLDERCWTGTMESFFRYRKN